MKKLFLGLIPMTILSAVSTGIVVTTFDPFHVEGLVKMLFFASLSVFLWGCGATVFFIFNFFSKDRMADSLRRGLFLSIVLLSMVFLNFNGLLTWYTGFASVILAMLLEFWIYKKSRGSLLNNFRDENI